MTVCPVTTPAAPQGAPTTPATPTAPAAPPPVPSPPPSAPAPAVPTAPAGAEPADGTPLSLTQEKFDALVKERLDRAQQSWDSKQAQKDKALAAALGFTDPNADVDPVKALAASQTALTNAQAFAQASAAEALALAAGIKPDKVGDFVRLVDLKGALKDVDAADPAAVRAALKTAVDTKATAYPEWTGSALPGSSGGDRSGVAGNGKKTWTRDEISKLSQDDLAKNADELMAAVAEGRIV